MTKPPPVRRHRPTPAQQLADLGRRLGVGALVLAALAIGGVADHIVPTPEKLERPFVRTGGIGDRIDARLLESTVLDVRGAAKIVFNRREYATGGVWVIVKVRTVAVTEPTTLAYAALRDGRGRRFRATTRFSQPLMGRELQPDIPVQGDVVFEVPKDTATDLTVELSARIADQRMDAMAEVPLPITSAQVDLWLATTTPTTIGPVEVVAP